MAIGAKANRYNILTAFFVTLGSFTYGYNSSVTAGVIGLPSFFSYFGIDTTASDGNAKLGAVNGVYLGGGVIGCWMLAWLADSIGRRRTIQITCLICVISAAIQAGSVHIAMFLVGRFVNGFGVGLINCVIPLYQSEISPPTQRGHLVGLHGAVLVSGYSMGAWTSFGTYYATSEIVQWRLPLAIQIIAPLLLLVGSVWLPESPRWLIGHGKPEQGMKLLENLHRTPDDTDATGAHDEFLQIQRQLDHNAEEGLDSYYKCFKSPQMRKRMIYGFLLQWLLQSVGPLVIFNYQTILYGNLGITGSMPILLLAVYGLVSAIFNYLNARVLDRVGRIRLMTIGLVGCVCDMTVYTALVAEFAYTPNKAGNAVAVLCIFLFAVFYGGCLDASSYVYCSEIFSNSVRARGLGFSVSGLFLANILYTQVAPTAIANVGWKFFLVFIIIPALGLIPFRMYYPETTQLSLEELAGLFDGPAAARPVDSAGGKPPPEHKEGSTATSTFGTATE